MSEIRQAQLRDLEAIASWLRNNADCSLWAGSRVSFPIDLTALPDEIEWGRSDSWSATCHDRVVAFGQIVPKPGRRAHMARLIAAPERRGTGLGRLLASHLLKTALSSRPALVSLNVAAENEPALNLYRALGFVEASRPSDEPESGSIYMEHTA